MASIAVLVIGALAIAARVVIPPPKVFMAEGNRRLACSPDALPSNFIASCVDDVQLMALHVGAIAVITAGLFLATRIATKQRDASHS